MGVLMLWMFFWMQVSRAQDVLNLHHKHFLFVQQPFSVFSILLVIYHNDFLTAVEFLIVKYGQRGNFNPHICESMSLLILNVSKNNR